jgi:hypothetical protein
MDREIFAPTMVCTNRFLLSLTCRYLVIFFEFSAGGMRIEQHYDKTVLQIPIEAPHLDQALRDRIVHSAKHVGKQACK